MVDIPPSVNLLATWYRPLRPFRVQGRGRVIRSAGLFQHELQLHQLSHVDFVSVLELVAAVAGDQDSGAASDQPGPVRTGFPLHHRRPVFDEILVPFLEYGQVSPGNLIRLSWVGYELG